MQVQIDVYRTSKQKPLLVDITAAKEGRNPVHIIWNIVYVAATLEVHPPKKGSWHMSEGV